MEHRWTHRPSSHPRAGPRDRDVLRDGEGVGGVTLHNGVWLWATWVHPPAEGSAPTLAAALEAVRDEAGDLRRL